MNVPTPSPIHPFIPDPPKTSEAERRALVRAEQTEAEIQTLTAHLGKYLDNHCANADAEGMSARCECQLCLDTRATLAGERNAAELITAEAVYRQNERAALRRLSRALTGGNADTWDEVFHAADKALANIDAADRRECTAFEAGWKAAKSRTRAYLPDRDEAFRRYQQQAHAQTHSAEGK